MKHWEKCVQMNGLEVLKSNISWIYIYFCFVNCQCQGLPISVPHFNGFVAASVLPAVSLGLKLVFLCSFIHNIHFSELKKKFQVAAGDWPLWPGTFAIKG